MTVRSSASYEREIASLNNALSAECANSSRLSMVLQAVADAWCKFDQEDMDRLLSPFVGPGSSDTSKTPATATEGDDRSAVVESGGETT